jgi:nickel-dependent lactate racemase
VVKTLHPLGRLASRIEFAADSRICLEPMVGADGNRASSAIDGEDGAGRMAVRDVEAAVGNALSGPLDFPPFAQAIVPGDHLAIAVDEAVPAVVHVVRGAIRAALEAGVEESAISVLSNSSDLHESLSAELKGAPADSIRLVLHDRNDESQLCPVGQMQAGDWLRINRAIFEADVVLPIGCAHVSITPGGSAFDSLFPRFSDAAAIAGFRKPARRSSVNARSQADEAGWLLGVPLAMQVVPAGDGQICDVVAGAPPAVRDHSRTLCRARWSYHVARRASLVIATVTGDSIEQRWENVARALAASDGVVTAGGAVAVCTDLDALPGPALARLAGDWDWAKAKRRAAKEESIDGWIVRQLANALERGPVYLLSQLEGDAVEEMGLAPVADLDELNRLVGRHESCIVLDDAQHILATVAGDS